MRQAFVALIALSVFVVGCPQVGGPSGQSADILAGDWLGQASDGTEVEFRFNSGGILRQVRDVETGDVVDITGATTTVSESGEVTITVPADNGPFVFNGMLDDSENTLTGEFGQAVELGDAVVVLIPAGELTLDRVETDGNGNDNTGNDNDNGGDDNANDNTGDNTNDNTGDDNANDNADDNMNDNTGDDNGNDNTGGGLTGDPANGEALVADQCAACHGADGASGFAPNIQGESVEEITSRTGGMDHPVYDVTEQDIADIQAYLASF